MDTDDKILDDLKKYGRDFINSLEKTLEKESDRGIILICASTLDSMLRDLIEKYLNQNKNRKKEIAKLFEYPNPLNTFASKIQMSYCMGLIKKEIYEDLERVRKIRNELAHGYDFKDFSSHEIASIVLDMEGARICWEKRQIENNGKKKVASNGSNKEKVDVRNISKLVFITSVMYWTGIIASYVEEMPAFLLGNKDFIKLTALYSDTRIKE